MKLTKYVIFALLAAAAVIGFASCSDETQDVNVTDTIDTSKTYTQYYTASGSITQTTIATEVGTGTVWGNYKTVETFTPAETANSRVTNISWTDSRYQNYTEYTVTVYGKSATNTWATSTTATPSGGTPSNTSKTITICKVGGKYYADMLTISASDGTVYSPIEVSVDPTGDTVELKWEETVTYYYDSDAFETKTTAVTNGIKYEETYAVSLTLSKIN